MKQTSVVLAGLAIVMALMALYSLNRVKAIRSEREDARSRQTQVVKGPPADPARFSHLRIAKLGKDASPMVFIPETTFSMGTIGEIGEFDEKPAREVTIRAYFIDLYEVSNALYQKFVEGTHRHNQEVMVFFDDVSVLFQPTLPAVGVSWFDANAYCEWSGKRLPTEAEWEHAARGNDQRQWPWGERFIDGSANIRGGEDGFAYTSPVGAYEAGRSPFGLYDMSGNVLEWVFDWYSEFFYKEGQVTLPKGPDEGMIKALRGGSWDNSMNDARTTKRYAVAPYRKEATIGFRCAMDAPS